MPFAAYNSEHSKAIISINYKTIVHTIGFFCSGQLQTILPHLEIETHGETPGVAPIDLIHSFQMNKQSMYEFIDRIRKAVITIFA